MGQRLGTPFAIDTQLRQIARPQLGLVSYSQAVRAGIDKHALARRRAAGALLQVFPGVMLVDPVSPTIEQCILAAALAVPRSIITGPSAAIVHGLPLPRDGAGEPRHVPVLSIDRFRIIRLADIRTIRQASRPPSRPWLSTRVTTPAATLLALPRYVGAATFERCLDHAIVHRLVTVQAMINLVERLPASGFVGRKMVLELLFARVDGIGHRSRLEQRVGRWLREAGLTHWRRNFRVSVGSGESIEVDFAWEAQRVALEVSPFFTHGSKASQQRDALRRRLLVESGWRVIEATDRDLKNADSFRRTVGSLRRCLKES